MPKYNDPEEAAQARAEKTSLNENMDDFQLFPKDTDGNLKYKGREVFNNMVKYRKLHISAESNGFVIPSKGLDIHLYQYSLSYIIPSESEVKINSVVKYAVVDGPTISCAKRKWDNWGVAMGNYDIINR